MNRSRARCKRFSKPAIAADMPDTLPKPDDLSQSAELAPPREPLPEPFWEAHGWTVTGAVLLVAVAAALWLRFRPLPKSPPPEPPAVEARRKLDALRASPPNVEALCTETARVVRRFLIRRLDLQPDELTTTELCIAVNRAPGIPADAAELATGFLRRCDVIKFAPDAALAGVDLLRDATEVIERLDRPGLPGQAPAIPPVSQSPR